MHRRPGRLACALWSIAILGPGMTRAACPRWRDLRAAGHLAQLAIGAPRNVGLRMSFVYVNRSDLGRCILGDTRFAEVGRELISGEAERHVFWIGVEGNNLDLFRTERLYMIQVDQRLDVIRTVALEPATVDLPGAPQLTAQALVVFAGPIDFAEPVTIFYQGGMGAVSDEYWFRENPAGGIP